MAISLQKNLDLGNSVTPFSVMLYSIDTHMSESGNL